jgi:hypothetical protein
MGLPVSRLFARVLVVAGLVVLGWVVGHAQTQPGSLPGDFELAVRIGNGSAAVYCVRGCTLTWAPKENPANGPIEVHVPTPTVTGRVTPEGCLGGEFVSGSCRILGWKQ